ncbi:hypothetical protein ElyMa_004728200 [Elysia marginata]|uniref:Uncharacterized protein n=1 Tax=Elysia marginata TaxID=1093978 RepID=A0AAV4IAI5_9GAST|nr:hypothetical protein ElyMa_004728200 [Elysia marginata]
MSGIVYVWRLGRFSAHGPRGPRFIPSLGRLGFSPWERLLTHVEYPKPGSERSCLHGNKRLNCLSSVTSGVEWAHVQWGTMHPNSTTFHSDLAVEAISSNRELDEADIDPLVTDRWPAAARHGSTIVAARGNQQARQSSHQQQQ